MLQHGCNLVNIRSEISHTKKDSFIITFNDRVLVCSHSWPTMCETELTVSSLQRSFCLCLLHVGVKGVCHHTPKRQVLMLQFTQGLEQAGSERERGTRVEGTGWQCCKGGIDFVLKNDENILSVIMVMFIQYQEYIQHCQNAH